MLFNLKIAFALSVLIFCQLPLNKVNGNPISNVDQSFDAAQTPVNPHQKCANRQFGCENGHCWSKCSTFAREVISTCTYTRTTSSTRKT